MLEPHDIVHDWCALCGGEIDTSEGWQFTSDRDGRLYAVHKDLEVCREERKRKDRLDREERARNG